MTEPDNLGQKIHALQQWQRAAWQQLADPMLTTFDRREIRNQIKQSDGELRYFLGMMPERTHFRADPIENVGESLAKLNFRLFALAGGLCARTLFRRSNHRNSLHALPHDITQNDCLGPRK